MSDSSYVRKTTGVTTCLATVLRPYQVNNAAIRVHPITLKQARWFFTYRDACCMWPWLIYT